MGENTVTIKFDADADELIEKLEKTKKLLEEIKVLAQEVKEII